MIGFALSYIKNNMPQIKKAILEELKKDAEFRRELKEVLECK